MSARVPGKGILEAKEKSDDEKADCELDQTTLNTKAFRELASFIEYCVFEITAGENCSITLD